MALTTQDDGDADAMESLARAELDRVVHDLVARREPARAEVGTGGALAVLVAARDARLWAAIEAGGDGQE